MGWRSNTWRNHRTKIASSAQPTWRRNEEKGREKLTWITWLFRTLEKIIREHSFTYKQFGNRLVTFESPYRVLTTLIV